MMVKKVVEHADNCIGTLSNIGSLVDNKVHLSGNGLAANSKQGSLLGGEEVDGSGLQRIAWVMHLLSEIKRILK